MLVELTDEQLLDLGSKMADALRERDKLETELLAVKKDYKARIDLSVSKAAEAAAEYRSGKRFETVSCDRFEDRTTMEVVWCDSVTGKEISRRPMTAEERQHRLELVTPDKPADNGEGRAEVLTLPAPPAANASPACRADTFPLTARKRPSPAWPAHRQTAATPTTGSRAASARPAPTSPAPWTASPAAGAA